MNMDFMKFLASIDNDINNANKHVYDLSTDEGLEAFNKQLDELKETDLDIFNLFDIDGNEWIDNMRSLGNKLHDLNNKKSNKVSKDKVVKNSVKQMERKEKDHSEEVENISEFKKPSELLSIDKKLKLHKLVQEYIDTTIKPYNNGVLSNKQINDAYAGLYEFAAWIMNK